MYNIPHATDTESYSKFSHPIAIFSGDIIHILYPNGDVEVTTLELVVRGETKNPLDQCLVWGYLEES